MDKKTPITIEMPRGKIFCTGGSLTAAPELINELVIVYSNASNWLQENGCERMASECRDTTIKLGEILRDIGWYNSAGATLAAREKTR